MFMQLFSTINHIIDNSFDTLSPYRNLSPTHPAMIPLATPMRISGGPRIPLRTPMPRDYGKWRF